MNAKIASSEPCSTLNHLTLSIPRISMYSPWPRSPNRQILLLKTPNDDPLGSSSPSFLSIEPPKNDHFATGSRSEPWISGAQAIHGILPHHPTRKKSHSIPFNHHRNHGNPLKMTIQSHENTMKSQYITMKSHQITIKSPSNHHQITMKTP